MLVLVVGGAAAYLAFLNHTVDEQRQARGAAARRRRATPDVADQGPDGGQEPRTSSSSARTPRRRVAGGRSDVIVLVHVTEDHTKVHLIHFPRDLYVDVPGHGKDKINAAYAYGGAPLLVRTIQNLVERADRPRRR